MALVWETNLSSSEKLVLLYYADRASDNGSGIWPSVETVSQKTGLSRRTIQRITKELNSKGFLSIVGKSKYHTKLLKINLNSLLASSERGDNERTNGVTTDTKRGDTLTPKPSLTVNKPSYPKGLEKQLLNRYEPFKDQEIIRALKSVKNRENL